MNLDDACHSADLYGSQWHGSLDVSLYPSTRKILEIRPHPSLDESPLMISAKKSMTLKRSISRFVTVQQASCGWIHEGWKKGRRLYLLVQSVLLQLQTGCRGCTLEAWYFGFPQQQQWMQDSMIMKRNVAKRRDRKGRQKTQGGGVVGVGLEHAGWRVLHHIYSCI